MRLLLLNPNTSTEVTDLLAAAARRVVSPGTEVLAVTAHRGVPFIASRAEAAIAGEVVLEMLARHAGDVDAMIVAAFADPGLGGLRELSPVPVVGLAEAAMLTACMLGARFAIVTFSAALGPWYRECVAYHGLLDRLAAIRMLDEPFRAIGDVQHEKADRLVELACRAVEEDEADVVILAGAPLAGLAEVVKDRIPVPLIDGAAAAARQAETLAALGVRKATAGSFRRPGGKPTAGLDPALARLIEARNP
ncbi:MAG: aspartate/glutamate racemase family protein [Pseudomonadota bacterium]